MREYHTIIFGRYVVVDPQIAVDKKGDLLISELPASIKHGEHVVSPIARNDADASDRNLALHRPQDGHVTATLHNDRREIAMPDSRYKFVDRRILRVHPRHPDRRLAS